MKVLLGNGSAYPVIGGVENSLNYIAQALLRQGCEVKILCFRTSPDQPRRTQHNGVEILRFDREESKRPDVRLKKAIQASTDAINSLLDEFQPDEIWTRWSAVGLGAINSNYNGIVKNIFPTTAKMDSKGLYINTQGLPWKRRLMLLALWPFGYRSSYLLERELIKNCKPVVFSQIMQDQLLQDHSDLGIDITVIAPGVDRDIFSPDNASRNISKIKDLYQLNDGEDYILYVGRLAAAKNISLLIESLEHLNSKSKLILVGRGPEESRLKSFIQVHGLTDRVIFVGSQSEMLPAFYALAKVCVLPTAVESFGQAYIESLSCGTPVVGFKANGRDVITASAEIIDHMNNGYLVECVSAENLALGIDEVLGLDTPAYQQWSQNASCGMESVYSWDKFVQRMLGV